MKHIIEILLLIIIFLLLVICVNNQQSNFSDYDNIPYKNQFESPIKNINIKNTKFRIFNDVDEIVNKNSYPNF